MRSSVRRWLRCCVESGHGDDPVPIVARGGRSPIGPQTQTPQQHAVDLRSACGGDQFLTGFSPDGAGVYLTVLQVDGPVR